MGTKSRDRLYGSSVRIAAERAAEARREADNLACEAWTKRMLAFKGPAQPSPTLGDALNAGYLYLEVRVSMVPTRTVDLVEIRGGDQRFDGRRIHAPLFTEARSIASNSVSLKRQPSASRLALA